MLEVLAEAYGWTPHYILFQLSFPDVMGILDARIKRNEQEQERSGAGETGYREPRSDDEPTLGSVTEAFRMAYGD